MGALFLAGTMGALNWHSLGYYFAHYWPALLILWGIIKLIEHEQAKRAGLPARGIGVGGIFLVIFIVCAGLIATQASRVNWRELGDNLQIDDDEGWNDVFGGPTYNYNGDLSSDWPAAANALRIFDDRGTITINVSDEKKLKVSWRKKLHAQNQSDADTYNSKTDVTITPADKALVLNANTQAAGDKGVTTDLDIYVPRNAALTITARRGDITIAGTSGDLQINHQRGDINISDLTGAATLNLERSSAHLNHIKGDVSIQGRANEVDVEDIDGAVHLNGDFMESVRLVRVSNTVSFRSSRTDLEFARLDGRLDLDSGDLRADSLNGPVRLVTRSKDISLEGLSGDLRLEDSNGTVEVGLRKAGNIQIDNRKGDIRVSIPPNSGLKVDARSHEGSIESDFSELKIDNSEKQSTATGSLGNGASHLVINGDNGSIEIRKGELAAATPPTPPTPAKPAKPAKSLPAPKAPPQESEN